MSWVIEEVVADVATLHGLGAPASGVRTIRWCVPTKSAIVLGSTEREEHIDRASAEALDVDVVRRRSGGGAVLVEPDDIVWADVFVPTDDPLWQRDVGTAFHWLGDAWTKALTELGVAGVETYKGALITSEWSPMVCFAGMGPGEVTADGSKIVGISQRRTREGALFQCSVYRRFRFKRMIELLSLADEQRSSLHDSVTGTVASIGRVDEATIKSTFERVLNSI